MTAIDEAFALSAGDDPFLIEAVQRLESAKDPHASHQAAAHSSPAAEKAGNDPGGGMTIDPANAGGSEAF